MKKRAAKTKGSTKAKRAARPAAAKTASAPRTSVAASYTPSPLKSDGWPPFRYPVR